MNIKQSLLQTGLFTHLLPVQLDLLIESLQAVTFNDGEIIIREGDVADVLYFIEVGVCEVYKQGVNGSEIILGQMGPGTYFGEQALLTENLGRRSATVRSVGKTKLFFLSHENFLSILSGDHKLKIMLKHVGRELKRKHAKLEEKQSIGGFGIWELDLADHKMQWSKSLYNLYGLDFRSPALDVDAYLDLIHPDDRKFFKNKLVDAMTKFVEFECEVRMRKAGDVDKYHCYHVICTFSKDDVKHVVKLIGFTLDITKRKMAEWEYQANQQQLLSTARRAGMADVATSILHNVGNVLNSASVSISLIEGQINKSYVEKLNTLVDMMESNKSNLYHYLSQDEKGKLIPEYIIMLSRYMLNSQNVIKQEVEQINRQLQYIKDITNLQKNLGGLSNVVEQVIVYDVIESAVMVCLQSSEYHSIHVNINCSRDILISTDKFKLLQILVNLIQNAKESLHMATHNIDKTIDISVSETSPGFIEIIVKDNGIGIESENLINIFKFGFTTKEDGHGFGLHSSVLAAGEMSGRLVATSDGFNKGAKFVLTMPISMPIQGEESVREKTV